MKICILGAAGFIGTNLAIKLSKDNQLILADQQDHYFDHIRKLNLDDIICKTAVFDQNTDFSDIIADSEVVYHLISTNAPTTSNQEIFEEVTGNISITIRILDACIRNNVRKIVFLSSGGTVYGLESSCPLSEDIPSNPISSYGIQKVTIEKLLYLYHYLYDLDYRIIRLSNPYGPYQRPNGILGAVSTFTYKALKDEVIDVYGDGSVVRDFIYIDDAIKGIINIANGENKDRIFNLGSGTPTSINQLLEAVGKALGKTLKLNYLPSRKVDIPVNYLNIERYENAYGRLCSISLEEGIAKTAKFMKDHDMI